MDERRGSVAEGPGDGRAGSDLVWERDGRDWPNREASRFVSAGGLRWHVQDLGAGPALLLLHGTGASTHSWAGLAPLLARQFRVIAPDLPGHGFTAPGTDRQSSLPGMAQAVAALIETLRAAPVLAVGHSAGAAVLARLCLDRAIAPAALVSLNGALLPLRGLAGQFFAPAAKLLTSLPLVPGLFAWRASHPAVLERLVRQTGSVLSPADLERYRRLVGSPRHVAAALRMMANWDLDGLARELPRLETPLYLVACENDRTVPAAEARRLARLLPKARFKPVPGLGHLGHEEAPALFAGLILDIAGEVGLDGAAQG